MNENGAFLAYTQFQLGVDRSDMSRFYLILKVILTTKVWHFRTRQ